MLLRFNYFVLLTVFLFKLVVFHFQLFIFSFYSILLVEKLVFLKCKHERIVLIFIILRFSLIDVFLNDLNIILLLLILLIILRNKFIKMIHLIQIKLLLIILIKRIDPLSFLIWLFYTSVVTLYSIIIKAIIPNIFNFNIRVLSRMISALLTIRSLSATIYFFSFKIIF